MRESVFNILTHGVDWSGIEGATVVDVFAGTGAYGLEALSRGARSVTFIDHDDTALASIRRNAAAMGETRSVCLLKLDAARLPRPPRIADTPCTLAFLDPPYELGLVLPALHGLSTHGWLGEDALVIIEVGARETFQPPPHCTLLDERVYGAAKVVFVGAGCADTGTP